jgi:hypothetical protein
VRSTWTSHGKRGFEILTGMVKLSFNCAPGLFARSREKSSPCLRQKAQLGGQRATAIDADGRQRSYVVVLGEEKGARNNAGPTGLVEMLERGRR